MDAREATASTPSRDLGDWSGRATTWLRSGREVVQGREEPYVAVSQSLAVNSRRFLGHEELSFRAEGFARAVFEEDRQGFDDDRVDLVEAEVVWRPDDGNTELRVGRQWVAAGLAANSFDGLGLYTRLSESFELNAFGGLPVDNGLGGAHGDFLVGGRVGYLGEGVFRTGVSTLYQLDDTSPAHGKVGLDLLYSPSKHWDFGGDLYYDWIGEEIYDSRAHIIYKPTMFFTLAADYSRTVPGLFLPKTSIFSVFSLDDYEEVSLSATQRLSENLSGRLIQRLTFYDDGSNVYRIGVGADLRYGPGGEDRVGADLGYQDEERKTNGSIRADGDAMFVRVYHLLYWTREVYTSADVVLNLYAGSPFGSNSTVGRLMLGYDPRSSYDVQVGVEYLNNTDFDDRLDLLARWTYQF